jgi:hypothetical protein
MAGLLLHRLIAYLPFLRMFDLGATSLVSLECPVRHFRSTELIWRPVQQRVGTLGCYYDWTVEAEDPWMRVSSWTSFEGCNWTCDTN